MEKDGTEKLTGCRSPGSGWGNEAALAEKQHNKWGSERKRSSKLSCCCFFKLNPKQTFCLCYIRQILGSLTKLAMVGLCPAPVRNTPSWDRYRYYGLSLLNTSQMRSRKQEKKALHRLHKTSCSVFSILISIEEERAESTLGYPVLKNTSLFKNPNLCAPILLLVRLQKYGFNIHDGFKFH